jgi:hypothetical protein
MSDDKLTAEKQGALASIHPVISVVAYNMKVVSLIADEFRQK